MAFTKEEIIGKSYEELSTGDALAENADVLNALSDKEKNTLATKIIGDCPQGKFKNYFLHIKSLEKPTNTPETFHAVLSEAYQVRQRIFALMDPRNKAPHTSLMGKEFNPELFHRFTSLVQNLLKNSEQAIAENLALHALDNARSQLAKNIDIAFPNSTLTTQMQAAFTLRRNIDRQLLGDKPEQFFTSRDYNKDSCNQFANMFRTLLKGHEEEIAGKLAAVVSVEIRSRIMHQLELLSTEVFDQTNPFKQIAESMHAKISAEQVKSVSQGTNPNALFAKSLTATPSAKMVNGLTAGTHTEEKEAEKEETDKAHSFF